MIVADRFPFFPVSVLVCLCSTYPRQVRAKALGDEAVMETAISFLLGNFYDCMRPAGEADDEGHEGEGAMLACLADDESPAVDLLVALSRR